MPNKKEDIILPLTVLVHTLPSVFARPSRIEVSNDIVLVRRRQCNVTGLRRSTTFGICGLPYPNDLEQSDHKVKINVGVFDTTNQQRKSQWSET